MPICKEKLVNYLSKQGYNIVRLPRTGINPLDVIIKDGREYDDLGSLGEVWKTSEAIPKSEPDGTAANILQKETSLLDTSIGLSALGNILPAMGMTIPKIESAFSKVKKMKLTFNNVSIEKIKPFTIGGYLRSGDVNYLDKANVLVKHFLEKDLPIYIISETLKSNSISIDAYKDSKTAGGMDVGIMKEITKANASIKSEKESESSITYSSDKALVFGFKCYGISYGEDGWSIVSIDKDVYLDDQLKNDPSPVRFDNPIVTVKTKL